MKINPQIFRNYDIRGVVDLDLDDIKVEALGKAYGTFLKMRSIGKMVCGRDCRLSGESYQRAFEKGVLSTGVDVVDLGLIMTQMMYFAQYHLRIMGGAILTASHMPKNFNGFKLAVGYSQTTGPEEVSEIRKLVESEAYYTSDKPGVLTKEDVSEDYILDVLKGVQIEKKFRVVLDSHCGTTGLFNPDIFRRAGSEVIEMNSTVDGSFPMGTPDPTDAKLMNNLAEVVKANDADIGFAFDGDGDRMGLVDEKGDVLWNDVVVAIFAKEILEKSPGSKIIYNTLCSQVVSEVVKQNGGVPIIWKTGHAFIKAKMAQESALFGGELSGHFFFADKALGYDDGTYAALRVLEYLSKKDKSLGQLYESFPVFVSSPEIKIGCPDDKKIGVIKDLAIKFKADFPDAKITDDTVIPGDDGVRADFDDGMIVFRYSQNGPYITIKFEAKDKDTFDKRRGYVREMLRKYPEMIWEDDLCVNLDFLR
jgi:phosphomannomutase/phosphoglucomutase